MKRLSLLTLVVAVAVVIVGCSDDHDGPHEEHDLAPAATQVVAASPTNDVQIPAAVRRNLGITFAKAEYRRVARMLRVPGSFELLPTARHEARASFGGTVQLLVKQYDRVQAGQPVARIVSPEWHRLQLELEEDTIAIDMAQAEVAVAEQTLEEGRKRASLLEERITRLQSAEVRRGELESDLAAARAALPRLQAEVDAKHASLEAARHHLPLAQMAVAAQLGLTREQLIEPVDTPQGKRPRWMEMTHVEVSAPADGVVDSLAVTDSGRVEANGSILTTIDPTRLRFRATALQADLVRVREGQSATIIAPDHNSEAVRGMLHVSPDADPGRRTIDLLVSPEAAPGTLPAWARPGVSAFVEVPYAEAEEELAIPTAAIVQDGLKRVFYRRDRRNPDRAIRTDADLGLSDGRWTVILSGLAEGDEVVLDGAYELRLATGRAGNAPAGGHFHADGTWHADGTPEPGGK